MTRAPEESTAALPLAGVRVIEIAQNIAGPYAGEILATLGADVLKIERPEGGDVDTSLFETALGWLSVHFAGFSASGEQAKRHRSGNPRAVVFQSFETSDGEVVIAAANDRLFAKLARELGHPEWATDPRFASNALRVQNREHVIPHIEAVLRTGTMTHWIDRLEAAGVPCAPINDLAQMVGQPQTEAIGIVQDVPGVDLRTIGLPVSFDGIRPGIRQRAPQLGGHNTAFGLPAAPDSTPSPGDAR